MLIIRPKTFFTLTESRLLKNSQNDEITDFFTTCEFWKSCPIHIECTLCMYDGSHEDVHTSCKVSLVETMEFATPVESAHNRRTNRPEREREKEKIRMCSRRDEGKISNLQKIRTLGGKRTFYNFEIATNYEIYKIRVNVSTFLYTL